ncbi:hypothetical protein EDM56_10615 [Brevibacillus fluminis]|uniref:Uncharacterized protein n=1 Tax=Brevibacillus fluminis TaxID=511487 RepID=A0A3M8DNH6_9BACL|nr:hypothetical protein EDM56_10615 [Brevibacillus fluminis]
MFSGYRPNHRVIDDYLTSGTHHYYDKEIVQIKGSSSKTLLSLNTKLASEVMTGKSEQNA